jgi:hypothetical protein
MLKIYGNDETQIINNFLHTLALEKKSKTVNATVKTHLNNQKNPNQKEKESSFDQVLETEFKKIK